MKTTSTPRRGFFSGYFVAAAATLLLCAVGLKPAINGLTEAYSKEPIDLRKKLDELEMDKLPSWRLATEHIKMQIAEGDVETEDVIHIMVEPDVEDPPVIDQALLFVTYYSDPRDRISHTPEVCYRQSGAVIESLSSITIETPGLGPETPEIEARLLSIDMIGRRTVLIYLFVCNGEFYHDRERVRVEIGWPGDKRIYFSKIEATTQCPTDDDYEAAVERCKSLIREALPVLVREHFPRNEDLR